MKKLLALLMAMLMIVAVFASCAPADDTKDPDDNKKPVEDDKDKDKDPVVEAPGPDQLLLPVPQNMSEIFPPVWDNYGGVVRMMMYSRLLRLDLDLAPVYFDLANKMDKNADSTEYTFTLNEATWHDGEALTANDVAFSVKASILGVDLNSVIRGAFSALEGYAEFLAGGAIDGDFPGVVVNDDQSITFKLAQASSTFELCVAQFNILPEHLLKDADLATFKTNAYFANPVGSGPYMVSEFVPNDYALLVPYEGYFGEKPLINKVKLSYTLEADYIVASQSDEIDYYQTMVADIADEVGKLENYTVVKTPIYFVRYMMWNSHLNDKLSDIRVRQALLHALNREDIATKILRNGAVTDTKVPASFDYYNKDAYQYTYDQAKATQLLTDAGFDFDYEIKLSMYYNDQTSIDLMDYLVESFAAINVKASYTIMQGDLTSQLWLDPQYDLVYAGLSAMSAEEAYSAFDIDTIMAGNGKNIYPTDGSAYDDLYKALTTNTDAAKRKEILIDLQKVEEETLWNLMICSLDTYIIYNHARIEIPELFSNDWSNYERGIHEWKLLTQK